MNKRLVTGFESNLGHSDDARHVNLEIQKSPMAPAAAPWLIGSAMAIGQAVLATACTLPTAGKCAGCGSCAVAVATLYGWANRRQSHDRKRTEDTGLEPFEIRTR